MTTKRKGTPEGVVLLTAAEIEFGTAIKYADFAVSKPDKLAWIKTHSDHALHTMGPKNENKRPGKGYDVK